MLNTRFTVELSQLPRAKITNGPQHQLLHVPDMVVVPYCQARENRWHCIVVGTRIPRQPGHITLTETQLAQASTSLTIDAERDPDGWARLLWLARVFRRFRGGPVLVLAQRVAEQLRPAGTRHVPIEVLGDQLGVDCLLRRLITSGYLTRTTPQRCSLTIPPEDMP